MTTRTNHALESAILPTFFRFWLPSLLGLLAMSTANIVDGIFIGNYVGGNALAAVNLIIPFFGLLFGTTFMLTMGGSVRAGKYIGEGNTAAASAIFSKTVMAVMVLAALVTAGAYFAEGFMLRALGGNEEVLPLMQTYWRIAMAFVWTQLMTVVLYFFVRVDGYPGLAAAALAIGALINIVLDYVFIALLGWGIAGAAWATGISQALPMFILLSYLFFKERHLHFSPKQSNWRELFQSAFNGLSEFINEVSGSIIALVLNWLFITRYGVEGVAAITVLNYILVIGMMLVFSIGDTSGVFISQNYGAKNRERIEQYLKTTLVIALMIAVAIIAALLSQTDLLVFAFLQEEEKHIAEFASELIWLIWPVFAVNGVTMIITSYLTALHKAGPSAVIAISRSLILPVTGLLGLYFFVPAVPFVIAMPIAEGIALLIAIGFFAAFRPSKVLLGTPE
ncbi:MATE family efflux transporter [Salinibius halmophilus]|uniref:MATE family efflux transporter n=1 Tax=Salinibius halmophilus TaxID=1853216 RepID=UPI000E66FF98|nr:MATE family efflux transporter [Salinibius halmophilus]